MNYTNTEKKILKLCLKTVGYIPRVCNFCGSWFNARSGKFRFCNQECLDQRYMVVERLTKRTESSRASRNAFLRSKNASSPEFRIKTLIHKTVWRYLNRGTAPKYSKIAAALPYTIPQLKAHLESQFNNLNGFTWANYGTVWELDHIVPQAMFHFETLDCMAFRDCWALHNLRPLECHKNLAKAAKLLPS